MTDFVPKQPSHLHRDLSDRMQPRKLDFSFLNWTDPNLGETERRAQTTVGNRDPAERSAPHRDNDENTLPRANEQQERIPSSSETCSGKKSGAWPWNFKWKWGSKSKSKTAKGAVKKTCSVPPELPSTSDQRGDEFASPSADIMSDARETFLSQSDRFSSRGSADKLASDRAPKHRRVLSWGAGTKPSDLTNHVFDEFSCFPLLIRISIVRSEGRFDQTLFLLSNLVWSASLVLTSC